MSPSADNIRPINRNFVHLKSRNGGKAIANRGRRWRLERTIRLGAFICMWYCDQAATASTRPTATLLRLTRSMSIGGRRATAKSESSGIGRRQPNVVLDNAGTRHAASIFRHGRRGHRCVDDWWARDRDRRGAESGRWGLRAGQVGRVPSVGAPCTNRRLFYTRRWSGIAEQPLHAWQEDDRRTPGKEIRRKRCGCERRWRPGGTEKSRTQRKWSVVYVPTGNDKSPLEGSDVLLPGK